MKEALFRNDLELVKEFVSQGVDVNKLDENGSAPLHIASSIGHTEIVRYLLDNGAEVNLRTQLPCPLLTCYDCTICASHRARYRGVCKKTSSDTPLHNSIESGRVEVCKLLIERGADIHAVDYIGQTPLLRACHLININNTEFSNDELKDDPVLKARRCLIQRDNILAIIKVLIKEGVDLDTFDKFGQNALMIAASNDLELVDLLLESGADVNTVYEDNTPLHVAVREGRFAIVKKFLDRAASVDLRSFSAKTPLISAVSDSERPSAAMVQLLIERGAKIDNHDCRERTIAHYAVSRGLIDILKIIHTHAPEVLEMPNDEGCRPLHLAFFNKRWDVVRYLLDLGLEVYCRTKFEAFPTKITIVEMQSAPDDESTLYGRLTRELLSRGSCFQFEKRFFEVILKPTMVLRLETLFQHVKDNNQSGVAAVLQEGVEINGRDAIGRSALHYAVENNNADIVRQLLDANINVLFADAVDKKTALHYAIESGKKDIVRIIIEHCKENLSLNNMRRLLKVRTADGKTALELARDGNFDSLVNLLVTKGEDHDISHLGDAFSSLSFNNGNSSLKVKIESKSDCDDDLKGISGGGSGIVKEQVGTVVNGQVDADDNGSHVDGLANGDGKPEYSNDANGYGKVDVYEREKEGTDVNTEPNKWTVDKGFFAVAKRLLLKYAKVELVTSDHDRYVEVTKKPDCTEEDVDLIDQFIELISKGMLLEAKTTKQGNTLLHLAPDVAIAETLLRRGALYEMLNNQGQKAIETTKVQKVKDLLNEVRKAFCDTVLGRVILDKLPESQAVAVRNARCRFRKQFQDYQKFYAMAEGYF